MFRSINYVCILLSFGFILPTGCSRDKELENVSVRMKWIYNGTVAEFFYGKKLGFFSDEGINLEIVPE